MSDFRPNWLVLHDYGGTPKGDAPFNPYNALVYNGKVIYRDPKNPYGVRAPHAYKLNGESVGLAWGGPVGGQPSEEDLALLRAEVEKVKSLYPGIVPEGHGEAYARTKGTPLQASRDGRDLGEASWRSALLGEPSVAPPPQPGRDPSNLLPVANRGMTFGHPARPTASASASSMPASSLPSTARTQPSQPAQAQGAFGSSIFAGLKSGLGAFAEGLGGGEQDDGSSERLAKMNASMLSEDEQRAAQALQMVTARNPRRRAGAFA